MMQGDRCDGEHGTGLNAVMHGHVTYKGGKRWIWRY